MVRLNLLLICSWGRSFSPVEGLVALSRWSFDSITSITFFLCMVSLCVWQVRTTMPAAGECSPVGLSVLIFAPKMRTRRQIICHDGLLPSHTLSTWTATLSTVSFPFATFLPTVATGSPLESGSAQGFFLQWSFSWLQTQLVLKKKNVILYFCYY